MRVTPSAARLLAVVLPAALVLGCDRSPVASPAATGPSLASAPGTFPPPAPAGVAATFRPDSFAVQVEWSHDGSQLADAWRVERRDAGGDWTPVASGSGTGGRLVDAAFPAGAARTLEYRALVCNAAGCGTSLPGAVEVPGLAAPRELAAVAAGDSIAVSWEQPADAGWITQVVRRTASTGFSPRLTTAPGVSSFVDRGSDGVTYYYMVRTLVPGTPPAGRYRQSAWSQEAAATPGGSGTGGPPVARADSGVAASASAATVYGAVTPNGQATTVRFQWSTSPSFASPSASSPASAGSGFSPAPESASLTGLAAGTRYYYRLIATNAAGADTSAALPLELAVPGPPRVRGSFARPAYEVALSWSAPGADWYRVERRTAGTDDAWSSLADRTTATWFRDGAFHPDTVQRFDYRVTACTALGCSASVVTVSTLPLPVPTNLIAFVGRDQVRLQWDANGAPAAVFHQVRRRTPGTAFVPRVTTAPGTTEFTDGRVRLDSTYLYEVRALLPVAGQTGNRRSAWSGAVSATPGTVGATPGITTDSVRFQNQTALLYGTVDVRANNTRAYFETSPNPTMVPAQALEVALPGDAAGPTRVALSIRRPTGPLYFRLAARDGAGTARGATLPATYAPLPLDGTTGVQARVDGNTYAVEVRWTPVERTLYYLVRGIRVEAGAGTGFRDDRFAIDQPAHLAYAVRACDALGCGEPSDTVRVTVPALGQPGGLEATVLDSTRVRLQWDDLSNGESGFVVHRRDMATGQRVRIGAVPANGQTAYVDTEAVPGTAYAYRVAAYRGAETRTSLFTDEASVTVPGGSGSAPSAATGEVAFAEATGGVRATLTGTVNANGRPTATWFEISTSSALSGADSLPAGTLFGSTPAARSAHAPGLARGTRYYYRMAAANDRGRVNGPIRSFVFDVPPAPSGLQWVLRPGTWTLEPVYTLPNASVTGRRVFIDSVEALYEPYLAPARTTPSTSSVEVRLCNVFGCGPAAAASTTVPAFPPPTFTATASPGRIDLTWKDNAGISHPVWELTGYFATSAATSYTIHDPVPGARYTFRLRERITGGEDSELRYAAEATVTVTAQ